MNSYVVVVPCDSIFIGERQRRENADDHINSLSRDILENGLIHAPTVDSNDRLVAGFCRLTAIKAIDVPYKYGLQTIQPGYVPVVRRQEGDERVLFRIELAENLRRKNLSPVDEARAVAQLHKMFVAENPVQTLSETGKALDELRGEAPREATARYNEVGDSLLIEQFASDPDVQKAASRREAVRIVKKKLEQELMGGLAAFHKAKVGDNYTLLEGSCIGILPQLQPESFHGIIVDPPYGMDADQFGEQTSATGHQYKDDEETAIAIAKSILADGYKLCKPDAHLYMFCDIRLWPDLADAAAIAGWRPFATPLIWHKPGLGHAPQPGYFGRRYECLLFAQKGTRTLSRSASDVFVYPAVKDKVYAAQKPVDLLVELLNLSFFPGEHVLDPCAGSGTIFRAAKQAKMRATGIELNPIAIGLAKNAIAEISK